MKIKELYRRRFPRKPPSHLPMFHAQAGPLPAPTAEGQLPYGHSPMAAAFSPPRPGAKQEVDVEHGTPPVHPLHPDVTMKRLPFYHVYDELIKPTTLGMLGGWQGEPGASQGRSVGSGNHGMGLG